jgi:hypothetical protein
MNSAAGHWFWAGMTAAAVIWYSTITIYVAVRGAMDIKQMLARLGKSRGQDSRPA